MIDLVRPELIIADHSPTVCVAASDRVPVVMVGDGFTIPPASKADFDQLSNGQPLAAPEQILRVVQAVQCRRKRNVPETLPETFRSVARFLVTFEELDPYRATRDEPLVGPMQAWPEPTEGTKEPRAFAYLDTRYHGVEQILPAFVAAGVTCSAYLRNHTPELVSTLQTKGVEVHTAPQSLPDVLPPISAIMHHAGLNTSTAALAAGRPQLVLPRYLEQDLNATALRDVGVGRILGGRLSLRSIGESLRELIDDCSASECAYDLAVSLH